MLSSMFSSMGVINVIIGLIFIYCVYSLLATVIQEQISVWLGLRARMLHRAVRRMLDDDSFKKNANSLADSFYNSPAIKYLGKNKLFAKPSYISSQRFSKTLLEVIKNAENNIVVDDAAEQVKNAIDNAEIIGTDTKEYLQHLLKDAQYDLSVFQNKLENWFDETMDRVRGWYKRRIQVILLGIGLTIAIGFNVNTIRIIDTLSNNPEVAAELVSMAENVSYYDSVLQHIDTAKIDTTDLTAHFETIKGISAKSKDLSQIMSFGWSEENKKHYCGNFWTTVLGWILTAFAISFGAPFWFDLLNKLISLRGTGGNSSPGSSGSGKTSGRTSSGSDSASDNLKPKG